MNNKKVLDFKYAGIQALYFAAYCGMIGYASVFLLEHGFSNSLIGIVLAISNIMSVILQPILASYVDKTTKISINKVFNIGLYITIALAIASLFLTPVILLFGIEVIMFTALMTLSPLLNSLSFEFKHAGIELNYGLARGIGSAAYAVASMIIGNIISIVSPKYLPVFYIVLLVLASFLIASFVLPKGAKENTVEEVVEEKEEVEKTSFKEFMNKYKKFMILLVGSVLVFYDHSFINNFFIQVITPIHGTASDMGNAVFLAAILELPTMMCFNMISSKFKIDQIIKFSMVFFTVKHALTLFASSMLLIYVAQAFQMVGYALFIPASVYYAQKLFDEHNQVMGQSLFTGAVCASGVIASLLGGFGLDIFGVHTMLVSGLILSVVGTLLVFISTERV